MANTAASVLAIAAGEIGYSRYNDPKPGSKYGRWYEAEIDQASDNYDFGANGVPFCAMGVSWTFDRAGAKCAGIPNSYCPTIVQRAKAAGKTVAAKSALPGDVVLFDWNGDGESDHVGLCEVNHPTQSYMQTIEFNTNDGQVARRTRSYSTICCVVRPYYGSSAPAKQPAGKTTTAKPSETVKAAQRHLIANGCPCGRSGADGILGPDTRKACAMYVQKALNALGANLAVDGVVGKQTKLAFKSYGPVKRGCMSYALTRAVQAALMANGHDCGSAGIDGDCGPDTVAAIKAFQASKNLTADGIVGPATFAKLFA